MVLALGVWLVTAPWVVHIGGDGERTQATVLNRAS